MSHILKQNPLPGTDLQISPICLGTMTFGNPVGEKAAIELVHWALDHGINFFDTADMYEGYDRKPGSSGGVAETILGKALKDRPGEAVVTTKTGNDVGQGANLRPGYIKKQCDASLARLQCDRIDIYELHKPDPATPLHQTLSAVYDLITTRKIRYWGFSNFSPDQISEMLFLCKDNGWPQPVVSQPPYNWLRREIETEHIPACLAGGISITPYQPLHGGLLTGKYKRGQRIPVGSRAEESGCLTLSDDDIFNRIEAFESEAHESGLSPGQYAVHWLLNQPNIISVVLGAKRIEQLKNIIAGALVTNPSRNNECG